MISAITFPNSLPHPHQSGWEAGLGGLQTLGLLNTGHHSSPPWNPLKTPPSFLGRDV
jgi:hypothetical protein